MKRNLSEHIGKPDRCLITEVPYREKIYETLVILDERDQAMELYCQPKDRPSMVGNIYTGKVERVVPGIRGAFVHVGGKTTVFLPLEDAADCVYTHKYAQNEALCGGDEILVQVEKDPIKTKDAMATCNISLDGRYVVLTTANKRAGISRKLSGEERRRWKAFLDRYVSVPWGIVIRTEAEGADEKDVAAEIDHLSAELEVFLEKARHAASGTLLKRGVQPLLKRARRFLAEGGREVKTDLPYYYESLAEDAANDPERVSLYEDPSYPLYKLSGIPTILERALLSRVWLSSGAYLVIEPTEALTVIDVNSGKKQKKRTEGFHFQVNLEAAEEIARQLRLRNISGIVLVDFINLTDEEQKAAVLHRLRALTRDDPAGVQVLDYTKLQLVEMTRQKRYPSLAEQMR